MRTLAVATLGLILAGCCAAPRQGSSAPPELPSFSAPRHAEPVSLAAALDAEAAARGRAIALVGCASCHAVDPSGASPFPEAAPFRDIVARRSLDDVEASMAEGLVTTHPAMPRYDFRAGEIDDLIAYMATLREARAKSP